MTGRIDARLKELGIDLPPAAAALAAYVPTVRTGNLIFVSGQVPIANGEVQARGKLGAEVSLEEGQKAARLCAINIMAQLKAALDGDLDRVTRVVKLVGFVNCAPDFTDIPKVVNGASELIAAIFGEAGAHARSAVGSSSLPLGVPVEVEAIVEVA